MALTEWCNGGPKGGMGAVVTFALPEGPGAGELGAQVLVSMPVRRTQGPGGKPRAQPETLRQYGRLHGNGFLAPPQRGERQAGETITLRSA